MLNSSPTPSTTAVIIARDEESMIANCIDSLRWCSEILVVDNGSNDTTAEVATSLGARVISFSAHSFAQVRERALKHVKTDWLIYIDADERVTPALAQEIQVQLETTKAKALIIPRQNMMYGKVFTAGGWQTEVVTRAFERHALQGWRGDIHESPVYEGETVTLHTPLIHLTHRSTQDGLRKTIEWTAMEAKLLAAANAAPVTPATLIRKPLMEFFRRLVKAQGHKDGMAGWVEAGTQAANKFFVYAQLWELQQKPTLSELYTQAEEAIAKEWDAYWQSKKE
jgi:glycosyltransferase involved in cell wall biosynthesis